MSALRRQAIGPFDAAAAVPLDALSPDEIMRRLQPVQRALVDMPLLEMNEQELKLLGYGQPIADRGSLAVPEAAAVYAGRLVAILARDQHRRWRPVKYFPLA